jgi:hypothetical protein
MKRIYDAACSVRIGLALLAGYTGGRRSLERLCRLNGG